MEEVSTLATEAQLARLIDRARKGEETIITDHGRPVARLTPVGSEVDDTTLHTDWPGLWRRMQERARAEGTAPFTEQERRALRDEGRR